MSIKGLKVGDMVYVVSQPSTRQVRQGVEVREMLLPVEKVGRKYFYVKKGKSDEIVFNRETGSSQHKCCNAHANGNGFQAYLTEYDYQREKAVKSELGKLKSRLVDSWGDLHPLSLETIRAISSLLDSEGLD